MLQIIDISFLRLRYHSLVKSIPENLVFFFLTTVEKFSKIADSIFPAYSEVYKIPRTVSSFTVD